MTTRLTRSGDSYRLNGRKWYATGTAFSDFASFSARNDEDEFVSVLLPVDRKGITILDDWDGMGQRLTASGGVLLEDVEVLPHEISTRGPQHACRSSYLDLASAPPGRLDGRCGARRTGRRDRLCAQAGAVGCP